MVDDDARRALPPSSDIGKLKIKDDVSWQEADAAPEAGMARFGEDDRRQVIAELERVLNIRLTPMGSRRKLFLADDGCMFCVVGGYGDWHELPRELVDAPSAPHERRVLVIAKKGKLRTDVYLGRIETILDAEHRLTLTKHGRYHFDVRINGERVYIEQFPEVELMRLSDLARHTTLIHRTGAR